MLIVPKSKAAGVVLTAVLARSSLALPSYMPLHEAVKMQAGDANNKNVCS